MIPLNVLDSSLEKSGIKLHQRENQLQFDSLCSLKAYNYWKFIGFLMQFCYYMYKSFWISLIKSSKSVAESGTFLLRGKKDNWNIFHAKFHRFSAQFCFRFSAVVWAILYLMLLNGKVGKIYIKIFFFILVH